MKNTAFAALLVCLSASPVLAQTAPSMPDPSLTPGAINPMVTQDNIAGTICVRGWTRTVRPSYEISSAIKRALMERSGFAIRRFGAYELDHKIPLELGGSPDSMANLWLEPRESGDGWTSDRKDELENQLNALVCQHRLPLATAQQAIATNWIAAYQQYVGAVSQQGSVTPEQEQDFEDPQYQTSHRRSVPYSYGMTPSVSGQSYQTYRNSYRQNERSTPSYGLAVPAPGPFPQMATPSGGGGLAY